ncbi:MAG: toll/interleukin-1 receptor domain-containing protein, partial [Acidobacteriaceae bacterium]|nr:toll/interleukin-1 receptor domain-containing protein [Acidobacteriaceae bacterium]MBV9295086.1 toll/interleukin-1 receptor domain-containing protein [Acidobacteriaceae bacterium]
MSHAFLSYVREDYDQIQKLAADLGSAGVDVWLDRERISPGENWRDAIRTAIANGA